MSEKKDVYVGTKITSFNCKIRPSAVENERILTNDGKVRKISRLTVKVDFPSKKLIVTRREWIPNVHIFLYFYLSNSLIQTTTPEWWLNDIVTSIHRYMEELGWVLGNAQRIEGIIDMFSYYNDEDDDPSFIGDIDVSLLYRPPSELPIPIPKREDLSKILKEWETNTFEYLWERKDHLDGNVWDVLLETSLYLYVERREEVKEREIPNASWVDSMRKWDKDKWISFLSLTLLGTTEIDLKGLLETYELNPHDIDWVIRNPNGRQFKVV